MMFYIRQYKKTCRLALVLGTNWLEAFFILIRLTYFMVSRKLLANLRSQDFVFRLNYNQRPMVYWLQDPSDIAALVEIYVDQEYEWSPINDPKVIVDLGAHFGDTALYYHARYPNAQIIAVEPVKANFRRLQKNTENIDTIHCVHAAIGDIDGETTVTLSKSSLGHSTMNGHQEGPAEAIKQITLRTLLTNYAIDRADIVKFDIEGAEELLCRAGDLLQLSASYIGEVHLDLMSLNESEIDKAFSDFRVEKKVINQNRYILRASDQT